jgi:hypothetical protein
VRPIRSPPGAFRRWLSRRYFDAHNGAPGKEAFQAALSALEAKAYYDGLKRDVFVRVGASDGKVYLDLCDDTWRAVEISTEGWRVISHPPVRFRRSAGMKPLPSRKEVAQSRGYAPT